jgi:hypothetical protein
MARSTNQRGENLRRGRNQCIEGKVERGVATDIRSAGTVEGLGDIMDRTGAHPLLPCMLGAVLLGATPSAAQISDSPPSIGSNMPSDIDPQSDFACRCPSAKTG